MGCLNPIPAWRENQDTMRGPIRFGNKGSQVTNDLLVGCGKCEGCLAQQALEWSVRIAHEAQMMGNSCFLTMTLNDKAIAKYGNKIQYEHLDLFFKRLRKPKKAFKFYKPKFKYFACGEYGSTTKRAHYHAIIMGEDFFDSDYTYDVNGELYNNKFLERTWGLGSTTIAPFSMATATYVAGYVNKKIGDPDTFRIMSRGLGKSWIEKYWPEVARNGNCVINGNEYPIPDQYFKWKEDELALAKDKKQSFIKHLTYNELESKRLNLRSKLKIKEEKL